MSGKDETNSAAGQGKGHTPTYSFFVGNTKYETDQDVLTGLQIKARVADWDQETDLLLEGHGHDPDRIIGDDEVVHLDTGHGPLRFSSAPKANFG